ncbi:MAG: protein kinase [Myxococcales bacterium]|nr:protein kinase [Myxococcales bacterium]
MTKELQAAQRWLDNGRYELLKRLGEGGFGVVYRAFDHKAGMEVALKQLKNTDAETHYRFKKEFRALADIAHNNLVNLHELVADDHQCFFTMELVEGVEFLEYVRSQEYISSQPDLPAVPSPPEKQVTPQPVFRTESASVSDPFLEDKTVRPAQPLDLQAAQHAGTLSHAPLTYHPPKGATTPPARISPPKPTKAHLQRLLHALRQLAQGVAALHRTGLLHRDLKPSNVLVTPEGRVVILDFGLVAELRKDVAEQSMQIAGTPAYMSPEQALHQPLTEACDWYSVGVMLYQSLTGRLPFEGSAIEILGQKHTSSPVPPQSVSSGIPDWLNKLCIDLLERDPSKRPQASDILDLLGAQALATTHHLRSTNTHRQLPLIGRTRELQRLRRAYHQTLPNHATSFLLEGASGIGKTHLARLSLSILQNEAPAMLLHARCYKQESIPYKAVDGIIGQLSHYLRMLPPSELKPLIPPGIEELTQVFPVFRRIRSLQLNLQPKPPLDPSEQRRQAFTALRELLRRLSQRRKLIFWIDDLQWGDVDSAALLIELLRPPEAPALMFLGCFRSEDLDSSPFLQKFFAQHKLFNASFPLEHLVLEGLTTSETSELAAILLGPPAQPRSPFLLSLAKQAGGNPSFLEELLRYVQQQTTPEQLETLLLYAPQTPTPDHEPSLTEQPASLWTEQVEPMLANFTLEDVFKERYNRLSPAQKVFLEYLAIAGQPTSRQLLLRTLEVPPSASEISQLRHQHLIRLREANNDEEIDFYHERLRETLLGLLSQQPEENIQEIHQKIAHELATEDTPDVKRLAIHLAKALDFTSALGYTLQAAKDAEEALAFGQAARWYRHALSLQPLELALERDILRDLAHALANQGLGEASAEAYLQAAEHTQKLAQQQSANDESLLFQQELRLQAATQLIRCGQLTRGLNTLSLLLKEFKLRWSHSATEALWTWLLCRFKLLFRKLPDASIVRLFYRSDAFVHLKLNKNIPALLQEISKTPYTELNQENSPHLDHAQALRLRACRLVSMEVGLADPLQGMAFQAQYLLEALRARDPYQLALAYSLEAAYSSFRGPDKQRRTEHLTDQALTLGKQLHHPHIIGTCYLTAGFAAFTQGLWRRAHDRCQQAERILRQHCTGVTWELSNCHIYQMNALLFMGAFQDIERTLPIVLREAEERGDLYTQTNLRLGVAPRLLLAKDQPEQALQDIERTIQPKEERAFHLQHYIELINRGEIALYMEQPFQYWEELLQQWPGLRRSLFLRIQFNRIELHHLRGRLALACASQQPVSKRPPYIKEAQHCAKVILRERTRWASPWALHLLAGASFLQDLPTQGLQHLTAAEVLLEDTDAHLYTHATMLARSLWLPQHQSNDLAQTALRWMQSQPIQAPLRLVQGLLPGCLPLP